MDEQETAQATALRQEQQASRAQMAKKIATQAAKTAATQAAKKVVKQVALKAILSALAAAAPFILYGLLILVIILVIVVFIALGAWCVDNKIECVKNLGETAYNMFKGIF